MSRLVKVTVMSLARFHINSESNGRHFSSFQCFEHTQGFSSEEYLQNILTFFNMLGRFGWLLVNNYEKHCLQQEAMGSNSIYRGGGRKGDRHRRETRNAAIVV